MTFANWVIDSFHDELSWMMAQIRKQERRLGPEDDWVEDDRRLVFEAADSVLRPLGRSTVTEVPVEDHIMTLEAAPDEVERRIHPPFQRNLLSTRKYRVLSEENGGRQYAVGSWVLDPVDTDWQQHVYLFPSPRGGTEVYGHFEPSVRDPDAHVDTSTGVHGDPNNLLGKEI